MQYFMGPRDEKNSGILLLALVFYHFGLPSLSNLLNCHLPPITASRSALHVGDKIKEPKKKNRPTRLMLLGLWKYKNRKEKNSRFLSGK